MKRTLIFVIAAIALAACSVAGVSLNKTTLSLDLGSSETLVATITPATASNKDVTWSSSSTEVATVDSNGKVTANEIGTATIMVKTADRDRTASCEVTVVKPLPASAVDLGLSVKWRNRNLGASRPEGYGDYYHWGETEPRYENGYAQETPQTHWKPGKETGYFNGSFLIDTSLLPSDDAAHVKLGGQWRMPTKEELDELRSNCSWTWTTLNGIKGYKVKSKISGYYWSLSLNTDNPLLGYYLRFSSDRVFTTKDPRFYGFSVRPVTE